MTDDILDPVDSTNYLALMPETQRDVESLAKAKYHADNHIKTLEAKMDELRADYLKIHEENQARATLEELSKQLEGRQQLTSSEQPRANEVTEKPLDLRQIDNLLSERLQRHEIAKKEQENADLVRSKLKQRFGDKYTDVVNEQINELGLTVEDFNAQARKTPKALLKALGMDDTRQETFQTPPRSQAQFSPKIEKKNKTWSEWQALKKENPRLYYDPKITVQMERDAIELGDAFADGDFAKFG